MIEPKIFKINIDPDSGETLTIKLTDKPVIFSDMVPLMHSIADVLVKVAASKADSAVQCGPGCGICCNQLVPLSIPEVLFMVEKLLSLPLQTRGIYLSKFAENEKLLDASGLTNALKSIDTTKNDRHIAEKYFELGLQCPFLLNQSCSIHPWRPVVCREFNSLSDPSLCINPFSQKLKTLHFNKRPSSVLARIFSDLTGKPLILVPFPLLFDFYEQFKNLSTLSFAPESTVQKMLDQIFA